MNRQWQAYLLTITPTSDFLQRFEHWSSYQGESRGLRMTPKVRYQVFVSSTYEDLREERQEATQSILEAECFPSGMELFPASDDTQWELIKRVIEESDYYIVIVGGRYGSVGPGGASYTEMEYDYAVEIGVPVMGFVRQDPENIPSKYIDKSEEKREKLEEFRKKVLTRTCRHFSEPKDLGMAVLKSLMQEARIRPRVGWIRADQARSADDINREIELKQDLEDAIERVEELERELRDRETLKDEIPTEDLARGEDMFDFEVLYSSHDKKVVSEVVSLTWNEILMAIGPSLYGYIQRRPRPDSSYSFEASIQHKIRSKIVDRVGTRKITIDPGKVDACVFHLKELGFVRFAENKGEDGDVFRGVTLTEQGEREMSHLMVSKRG